MKQTTKNSLISGKHVVAGLIVAGHCAAQAQEAKQTDLAVVGDLEPTTVIATKFEDSLENVSSSVAVLDADALIDEGKISVQDAIGYRTPGVISTSTAGQRGQSGSLFIRGTTTKYSQMRLDGVRVSDSSSLYNNFLGSSNLYGYSTVEVLKGASSSFYGGGAIGGVVSLTTAKGAGEPSHQVNAEYGSFNSWLGNLNSQGQIGDFSYNVGITAEDTQNDSDSVISGNDFRQQSYYSRFDYAINSDSSLGLTFRVNDAYSETPERGNPLTGVTQKNHYDNFFGTLFYQNQLTEIWDSKLTFGYSKEDFDSRGFSESFFSPGSYSESNFDSNTDRYSAYWDNQLLWSDQHQSVLGAYFENSKYKSTFQESKDRDTFGLYVNHAWQVIDQVLVNGSLGYDDHDDFGDVVSWNAGAIVDATQSTKLRANAGTGFRAPSFGELGYNKQLEAEESFSWDLGVEQSLGSSVFTLAWFETDVDNLIEFGGFDPITFAPLYSNTKDKSKASGLEFSAKSELEQINSELYASYTYYQRTLDAIIPEHTAAAGIKTSITDAWNAGLNATWVDERKSSDPVVDPLASYFLLDLFTNYQINDNWKVHGRVENLLDDHYFLSDFSGSFGDLNAVKGRGRGFYAGVTASF
ncbi:TonB-dependent receptor plug domain-containing protein [Rubritalea marina]|uniref:TonB-dependent receptor plug domain-containing protein n=1 Tax=Rubritalea marina TaxID=361055 RepID=UPI0003731362|nr:TonB-dependent receptor [Rubritalea marina]